MRQVVAYKMLKNNLKEIKAWVFFNFPQKSMGGLYFED